MDSLLGVTLLHQVSTQSTALRNQGVNSLMDDQVALPVEHSRTEPAGVRHLAGMHPFMDDQVLFQVKALLAELTNVGFLFRVGPLVLFKKLPEFTGVWTDGAAVPAGLLPVLHPPVQHGTLGRSEELPTPLAAYTALNSVVLDT